MLAMYDHNPSNTQSTSTISDLEFRPRFKIYTDLSVETALEKIRTKLKTSNRQGFRSSMVKDHVVIRIHESKSHFWSPQLDISIQKDDDSDKTLIRCLLAPAPVVWTMFMFFYALSGFAALVGLTIALSQWSLKKEMWGFWILGISLAIGIALFFIAQFGKAASLKEMKDLSSFIKEIDWNVAITFGALILFVG